MGGLVFYFLGEYNKKINSGASEGGRERKAGEQDIRVIELFRATGDGMGNPDWIRSLRILLRSS